MGERKCAWGLMLADRTRTTQLARRKGGAKARSGLDRGLFVSHVAYIYISCATSDLTDSLRSRKRTPALPPSLCCFTSLCFLVEDRAGVARLGGGRGEGSPPLILMVDPVIAALKR